jgi:hypothetical protein
MREQSSQRSDERPIGGSKPRTLRLTRQNGELVSQQHQFHVLGEFSSTIANEQPQNSSKGKVGEGEEHRAILPGSPANELAADSSCTVERFLVNARARETQPGRSGLATRAANEHRGDHALTSTARKGLTITAESALGESDSEF